MLGGLGTTVARLRRVSTRVFGNEKSIEVLRGLSACGGTATAQEIAKHTGIDHAMVRAVLRKLVEAGILDELPRTTSRGALYYEAHSNDPIWRSLVGLANVIHDAVHLPTSDAREIDSDSPRPDIR